MNQFFDLHKVFILFKYIYNVQTKLTSLRKLSQNREIRCCWYSSHETVIIIFKYQKSQGQSLRSDFTPDTSHKAHNGAAKSVRKRPSFPAKEQARSENLPIALHTNSGEGRKARGNNFCHSLFGLKLRAVLWERIRALLGFHIKMSYLKIDK